MIKCLVCGNIMIRIVPFISTAIYIRYDCPICDAHLLFYSPKLNQLTSFFDDNPKSPKFEKGAKYGLG